MQLIRKSLRLQRLHPGGGGGTKINEENAQSVLTKPRTGLKSISWPLVEAVWCKTRSDMVFVDFRNKPLNVLL